MVYLDFVTPKQGEDTFIKSQGLNTIEKAFGQNVAS